MSDAGAELVSVIIPAYNARATIAQTLRSAQLQRYPALEIIVVDDGSQDGTDAIVADMARDDPRVTLIRQANAGVAAARNAGLTATRGQLIAPLDADDLWHRDKIAEQIRCLSRCARGTGLVYCWSADIDEQGMVIRYGIDRSEGQVYAPLVLANFVGNSSVPLMRRELVDGVGGWDTSLREADAQGCEDWLLYLKLAERSLFALAPAVLVGYRQTAGAMSRNVPRMRRSYSRVMRAARDAHPELPNILFRWSRAEFDFYCAQLCWSTRDHSLAAFYGLRALGREPSLFHRVSAKNLLLEATRRIAGNARWRRGAGAQREGPQRSKPVPFDALVQNAELRSSEAAHFAARRRYVEAIRVSQLAH
ncbi:Glycosyltransferase involved in cell wall bisynthesis [Rhizobiales bacterium GAS188]|nr:Glycosyltransferase involved in cell wall bisynthesis [Rhizobiales bacterium GAS188]